MTVTETRAVTAPSAAVAVSGSARRAGAVRPGVSVIIPTLNGAGPRFAPGAGRAGIAPLRRLGDKALGAVATVMYRTRYAGLRCGCNAFRASAVPAFGLQPDGDAKVRGTGSRSRRSSASAPPPPAWPSPRSRRSSTPGSTASRT